ncbi:hypothetical protein SUNI508_09644 [Seiridium unicorne]|uniref:Ankyrin n=1 Tax=Seiridium unicorne TaxID=138068 RepID=A0ABR2UPG7_9PEZI
MSSTRPRIIAQDDRSDEASSPNMAGSCASSSKPEPPTMVRSDIERMKTDLKSYQQRFVDACRNRKYKEAATCQRRIIDLRDNLSASVPFPLATRIEANLRQAVILLMCEDVDGADRSLFPDLGMLSQQRGLQHRGDTMAWGVLCAKVGFLYMRSTAKDDLEKAKDYLNRSLNSLVEVKPNPAEHLFAIAQCLADLYDFTTNDATSAEGMVEWLSQKTGLDTFRKIAVSRVSTAIDWCKSNGFGFDNQRFDVSAMEHAIKQNEPAQLETMLTFTERTHPSSTLPSRLLLTAAETRNLTISQLLFEHKANVDAVDEEGKTVLHRCLYCRDPAKEHGSKRDGSKIAGFFLSKNSRLLDKRDHSGKTALYVACDVGYVEMVSFLLGIEANANITENNAQTPLYMACERGRRQIVRCLLEKAKDLELDARGPGGQTPLIVAVQYAAAHAEGKSIVEQLLKKGADPSIEDNTGKTAVSYVGGIWASDLKSTLKNARNKSSDSASAQRIPDMVNLAIANSFDKSQKHSRPPSTRTSMLAKMWQPRVKSGASSLFSPSRTSLDTVSRPAASIFSNDISLSRRTSITAASSIGFADATLIPDNEAMMSGTAKGRPVAQKDGPGPLPSMGRGRFSDDAPDNRSMRSMDTGPRPSPTSRQNPEFNPHNQDDTQSQRHSGGLTPPQQSNSLLPIKARRDVHGTAGSIHSSTDSEYDTPSDSEEASYDGEHSPLEPRHHSLPVRSHPGRIAEHPSGNQGQQSGAFDGASSIPTPPSDQPGGTGSTKATSGLGNGSGSRGGKVRNAAQAPDAEQKRQVLLACPFAKKDPITYEHCHNYELKEIKHVKQHLKRCHLIVVCARCMEGFSNQDIFDQHIRAGGCEISNREPPEGMTIKQHEILKPRTNHKLSLEEQWFFIWDTLFPGRERPPTPYKDEFVNLTEFHKLMRDFRDHQIPTLAARLLNELGIATTLSHDQAVVILRRGMLEFASTLQQSGVLGQNDHSTSLAGPSGSASITGFSEPSPSQRQNSLEGASDQHTPDSNDHLLHQGSPGSTQMSNDEYYQSLQPIEEVSTNSSSYRQGSVGVPPDVDPAMHQIQQGPPRTVNLPHEHTFHPSEWSSPYSVQAPDTAHGHLLGVGAGWNDTAMIDNYSDPLYSPNHIFNMDSNSMDQMLHRMEYDINMDLDMNKPQGGAQPPIQTPGYFPIQHAMEGQQASFIPVMGGGRGQAAPYPHMLQNTEGQNGYAPTGRQAGNIQGPHWNMH